MAGINKVTKDQINAFWSKVDIKNDKNSCWNWTGAKKPKGYGNVKINGSYLLAHRVAFELVNGEILGKFLICHICDNPSCCNPNHLMLGTTKSNAADMLIKNRQKSKTYAARGEKNGHAKLTELDVKEIRERYAAGTDNQYELADQFGVTQPAIGCILRRQTWKHVA